MIRFSVFFFFLWGFVFYFPFEIIRIRIVVNIVHKSCGIPPPKVPPVEALPVAQAQDLNQVMDSGMLLLPLTGSQAVISSDRFSHAFAYVCVCTVPCCFIPCVGLCKHYHNHITKPIHSIASYYQFC